MADEIDFANDLIDVEVSRAINRMRQQTAQSSEGSKTCTECGEDMPEARRKMGFKLCVPCAQESERRGQLFAD
jgi:RNA polymerase-binding transcription factor DksA